MVSRGLLAIIVAGITTAELQNAPRNQYITVAPHIFLHTHTLTVLHTFYFHFLPLHFLLLHGFFHLNGPGCRVHSAAAFRLY